MSVGQLGRK